MIEKSIITLDCLCQYNTFKFVLEPFDSIILGDLVVEPDSASANLSLRNTGSCSCQTDEEIHTIDTRRGVVLDPKIDVLGDSEAEVAVLREVLTAELVLADLEEE